jgi:hypothetical protein
MVADGNRVDVVEVLMVVPTVEELTRVEVV